VDQESLAKGQEARHGQELHPHIAWYSALDPRQRAKPVAKRAAARVAKKK
jgi:hypothetical protein